MAVGSMRVSPDITDRISDSGVRELADWLWPVDCQTCGRPLGGHPPALCVDDMIAFAAASLHHEKCRAPGWNESGTVAPTGNLVTHRTRLFMLPLNDGRKDRPTPALLVNPTMELVMLHRDNRTWRPEFLASFTHAGMRQPGPETELYKPAKGMSARLAPDAVTVILPQPSAADSYTCGLGAGDEAFYREIDRQRGVMLAASHAIDPHSADLGQQLDSAFRSGRILLGWVPLSGT